MTPEERRRRGLTRVALGVGLLVLVVVITIMILPNYMH
jgi:hypothetical protein